MEKILALTAVMVGASLAASPADEPRLDIGKPYIIGPAIGDIVIEWPHL